MRFKKLNAPIDPFCQVTTDRFKLYFQALDPRKASGTDKILPKLMKLSAKFLTKPLFEVINNNLASNTFPLDVNVAIDILCDKKTG